MRWHSRNLLSGRLVPAILRPAILACCISEEPSGPGQWSEREKLKMRNYRKVVLFAAVAAVGLGVSKARADTYNWSGTGIANPNWSQPSNWGLFSLSTPGPNDQAVF